MYSIKYVNSHQLGLIIGSVWVFCFLARMSFTGLFSERISSLLLCRGVSNFMKSRTLALKSLSEISDLKSMVAGIMNSRLLKNIHI